RDGRRWTRAHDRAGAVGSGRAGGPRARARSRRARRRGRPGRRRGARARAPPLVLVALALAGRPGREPRARRPPRAPRRARLRTVIREFRPEDAEAIAPTLIEPGEDGAITGLGLVHL